MSATTDAQPIAPRGTKRARVLKELLGQLLESYQRPEDLLGENGFFKRLTGALTDRALDTEIGHHLRCQEGNEASERADQ